MKRKPVGPDFIPFLNGNTTADEADETQIPSDPVNPRYPRFLGRLRIIGKQWPRRAGRTERRAMELRLQSSKKSPIPTD